MKIDSFITCVGDNARKFLSLTLGFNKKFFDETYIITTYGDIETEKLCQSAGVNCLVTDLFYKNNAVFNRGATLNKAFEIIQPQDWIVSMDADCILKNHFLDWKNNYNDSIEYFWGMRRTIVPTINDLEKIFAGGPETNYETPYGIGYGFFQLWNVNSSVVKSGKQYPESYNSAESDWKWRNNSGETINGDKEYTGLLKEIPMTCLHLGPVGENHADKFFA